MTLSESEAQLYFSIFHSLLVYVNEKKKIHNDLKSTEDIPYIPDNEIVAVRDALYQDTNLFDTFVQENPYGFSDHALGIVNSWKNFLQARFYIVRHLKKHTIFLSMTTPPIAYGVTSLRLDLQDMFPHLPAFGDAVLLPFEDKIVYDGYIGAFPVTFGGGMKRMVTREYNEAKAMYGIVTTLPFEPSPENEADDTEKLKFYLKNQKNRFEYDQEIHDLIKKNPQLESVYYQEMGKAHARSIGQKLRAFGFQGGWFGLLEDVVVASGETSKALEQNIAEVVPKDMHSCVYRYRLKKNSK